MVANLRADNIDGFLGPDPMNQRAVYDGVGFIHILTKDIWEGHPCCAFAASKEFVTTMPNTYAALLKSIIDATAFAHKAENRKQIDLSCCCRRCRSRSPMTSWGSKQEPGSTSSIRTPEPARRPEQQQASERASSQPF